MMSKPLQELDKLYLDFMPAAIAIERSPAPVYGRLILWTIVVLVLTVLAWAWFGRIDIVAVAPGKIVPTGKAKIIQAYERSVVKQIHVRNGQQVQAGELLVSLDASIRSADERRAQGELQQGEIRWLQAEAYRRLLQLPDADTDIAAILEQTLAALQLSVTDDDIALQKHRLQSRISEYRSQVATLRYQLRSLAAEKDSALATRNRYQRTLPIVSERVDAIARLNRQQLASRDLLLQLQQQQIEHQQGLMAETARVAALAASIEQTGARMAALQQRERGDNLTEINRARHQVYLLTQSHHQSVQRQRRYQLRAPIDGSVQELQIHTVGGIVSPAQPLLTLIPGNDALEIEAFVRNRDIGFVHEGQTTAVKVDTFIFTRYGTLEGKLKILSSDAIDKQGLGLVYPATVELASTSLAVEHKRVSLAPGMAVTVEIKTGSRRIIEFFLSPLLKLGSESLHER